MITFDRHPSGRHFLQIPGPTNVPDRVLRAIDNATIDHRGPEFAALTKTVLAGMKGVFKTQGDVVIYPASGTGAWEAALVNTLSSGDQVLMAETGQFASLWSKIDRKSTRLNSSHVRISYAVFCLKKKKNTPRPSSAPSSTQRMPIPPLR